MPTDTTANKPTSRPRPSGGWVAAALIAFAALGAVLFSPSQAAEAGPSNDTLRRGAEVYSSTCAACHQAGGVGLSGVFPPLIDNAHVDDADYLRDVIQNGRTGEITVGSETFNGVMPPQSTLGDDDVDAVIAYIQSGFAAPSNGTAPEAATETSASAVSGRAIMIGLLAVIVLLAAVMGRRILATVDRRKLSWLDAWLKTLYIVIAIVVATVIIPAKFIETSFVEGLPRVAQDLLTVGIWSVMLVASIGGLWYLHRTRRI